jgi:hypothetical protein
MSRVRVVEGGSHRIASTSFVWTWDEAKALNHALPKLRSDLKEAYNIDNIGLRFRNPWGGPNHTEFSLIVELAKGATGGAAATLSKWLLDWGRAFVKEHRKRHKKTAPPKKKPQRSRVHKTDNPR